MDPKLCYIKESYFTKNSSFVKVLDVGDTEKQSKRTHLCIEISLDENKYYLPLRNKLGDEVRKFGRIGHSVPSKKRKNAGIDYRYALIVNDPSYIEIQTTMKIPQAQYNLIKANLTTIETEFKTYLNGFKKAAKKNRIAKEPLYRESSLVNFLVELGIN